MEKALPSPGPKNRTDHRPALAVEAQAPGAEDGPQLGYKVAG